MHSFFEGPLHTEKLIQTALKLLSAKDVLYISGEAGQGYTREEHQHLLMQTIQGLFLKGDATYKFAIPVDCAERARKTLLIPHERAKGNATLDGLCRHLLRRCLPKDPAVRLSNWKNRIE
jgi:hypothetical protein